MFMAKIYPFSLSAVELLFIISSHIWAENHDFYMPVLIVQNIEYVCHCVYLEWWLLQWSAGDGSYLLVKAIKFSEFVLVNS